MLCSAVPGDSFQPPQRDFELPPAILDRALLQHAYKKLSSNWYNETFVQRPRHVPISDDDVCDCKDGDDCDENCINRAMHIECSRRCPKGDKCHNQRLARKQYAQTKIVKVSTCLHSAPPTAVLQAVCTVQPLSRLAVPVVCTAS